MNRIAEIEISYKPRQEAAAPIKSSQDAYELFVPFYSENTIALQEQFTVAYLNRANVVLGVAIISKVGLTGTVADPRLIMATALIAAATGIILCHNHPSGNLTPSKADQEITKKLEAACEYFDIKLLDHLILSPQGTYFSFVDEGIL